ncbi:hypothetical protein Aeqsu_2825 [Aequorivita sublithincola DSM 14238]|uniref:Uncharacterized protein n=1 Tax=Aequorivita sublithincola (strain DSM 14238 / LMG 21431 / ACAM 643 / 9-3) TaxID=746697 RepID=I3YZ57_AEQSU|nr:hypothetical protein [Aequorivita sublithincola]AFL82275.1 hypothetical protein Aeqsu_2825 [Aequorivita sublithincola DSM 14238]
MRLSYYCKSCNKKNYLKTKATNRFKLQTEVGDEINNRCSHCGTLEKKHINRLFAQPSIFIGLFSLALGMLLTGTIFMFGFIAILSITIPIWIYFDSFKKASNFNKVMISRK